MNIGSIIIGAILVEAITGIVTKSGVFLRFREFIFSISDKLFIFRFLSDMIQCPYCFSVWAGWFISVVLNIKIDFDYNLLPADSVFLLFMSYFFSGLVLHRLANILHSVIDFIVYSFVKPSEEARLRDEYNKEEGVSVGGFRA